MASQPPRRRLPPEVFDLEDAAEAAELVLEGDKANKDVKAALNGVVGGEEGVLDLLDLFTSNTGLQDNKGAVSVSAHGGTSLPF